MNASPSDSPRVSFIVPVYNDAVRLQECLRSIRANSYPSSRVEIVVVDNGSQDDSAGIAKRSGATVLTLPHARVPELRNRASRIATGDVLAFVDADHELAPEWIASAIDALQLPAVAAVGALCDAPPSGTWVQCAYAHLRGRPQGRRDVEWLGSGNLAVWRSAFEAVGGFDTSLETCEDVDLCHRLRASRRRVVSDDRLTNIHYGDPATLWELFKGELWRGRDNLRVSFRRPLRWRTLASAVIPMVDVLLIGIVMLGLLMAGWTGLSVSLLAALALSVPAGLKVVRAAFRPAPDRPRVLQTFAVAWVYEMGRALALVSRMPHRGRSSATT